MLSASDFDKKQVVFVFFNQGEKLSFSNDNFVVRTSDGTVKFQCTCYRLFLVFAVGHGSVTSGLIQRAKKFGFSIVMMTPNLKPYQTIGSKLEGNTLLRRAQYQYNSLDLAKHITQNKIFNQCQAIESIRNKNDLQKEAIAFLNEYYLKINSCNNIHELLGYEGSAAKVYFRNYFNNVVWKGRVPRAKPDIVNALLDIGYTILFSFVDGLLSCYGFDVYCGILHRDFYMRKSLVCDIVEPFRVLVDMQIRKSINLKQCKEDDFMVDNGRYLLKWKKNAEFVAWLAKPIIEHKNDIHLYIQSYYRSFMKHKSAIEYPFFTLGGTK